MEFVTEKIEFLNKQGNFIAGRLEKPLTPPLAYAIFAHCFTCSKDVHAATRISRALTAKGIAVLRFDFTGLGNSEGDFSNTNFSTNQSDLMEAHRCMSEMEMTPTMLIGHSLGGAAVLAAASELPEVKAVVTIGAPSKLTHVEHLFKSKLEDIETKGEGQVVLAGRNFTIKKQFLDDLRSISLESKISRMNSALLIFHSPQDETVSIDHARAIFEHAKHPKSFIGLDGASHLLNDKEDSEYVAQLISAWSSRYLLGRK